jgi:hypothetical protein
MVSQLPHPVKANQEEEREDTSPMTKFDVYRKPKLIKPEEEETKD